MVKIYLLPDMKLTLLLILFTAFMHGANAEMGAIIYNNQIDYSNVSSITHTSTGGTVTADTDIDRMFNRSLLNAYKYTVASGTSTLTINYTDFTRSHGIGLLGHNASAVTLKVYNNASEIENFTAATQYRIRYLDNAQRSDLWFDFDESNGQSYNKLEFTWISESGQIGTIYGGSAKIPMDVRTRIQYDFVATGAKSRTLSGGVIGEMPNAYMTTKFTVSKVNHENLFVGTGSIPYTHLNYTHGETLPLMFIANGDDGNVFYGTQSKPFSIKHVEARDENSNWYYDLNFQLEEEL